MNAVFLKRPKLIVAGMLAVACIVMPAASLSAEELPFDMLNPAYSGFNGPDGTSFGLDQTVDGRTGVATLLSGTDPNDGTLWAGGIWENSSSLGVPGAQLKDITGFSFDYNIQEGYSMSGGARLTMYVYYDAGLTDLADYMHFDGLYKLDQTTGQWLSTGNMLEGVAGYAHTAGVYAGDKTWDQIVTDHGDLYWSWAGIIQDNSSTTAEDGIASIFSVDNIVFTTIPEPASMSLLGLGGLALLRRRRNRK